MAVSDPAATIAIIFDVAGMPAFVSLGLALPFAYLLIIILLMVILLMCIRVMALSVADVQCFFRTAHALFNMLALLLS